MGNFLIKRVIYEIQEELPNIKKFGTLSPIPGFRDWFLYLDDNVRGETRFPLQDTEVSCVKNSLVLFPPLWPWIHSGAKPVDKPKYIIGTYLHYV